MTTTKLRAMSVSDAADEAIRRLHLTQEDARGVKGFAYPQIMVDLSRVARKCRAEGMYRESASAAYRGLELYEALKLLHRKDPHFQA